MVDSLPYYKKVEVMLECSALVTCNHVYSGILLLARVELRSYMWHPHDTLNNFIFTWQYITPLTGKLYSG